MHPRYGFIMVSPLGLLYRFKLEDNLKALCTLLVLAILALRGMELCPRPVSPFTS